MRTPALIAGALLATMVGAVVAGNAVIAAGIVKNPDAYQTPAKIVFFSLFVAFGFSLIPVMVRLVLGFQVLIGNANLPPIRAVVDRSNWIVGAIWTVMVLGLATGLPAAIRQGFFSNDSSPAAAERAAAAIARIPGAGTLVAARGMPARRMIEESTLRVRRGRNRRCSAGPGLEARRSSTTALPELPRRLGVAAITTSPRTPGALTSSR